MSLIVSDLLARGQGLGGGHLRGKCRRSREKGETCDGRTVPSGKRRRRSAVSSWQIIRLAQCSALRGRFPGKASGVWAELPVFPAALRSAVRSEADYSARRPVFGPNCPFFLPPCAAQCAQRPIIRQGVRYLGRNARFSCRLAQHSALCGRFFGKAERLRAEVPATPGKAAMPCKPAMPAKPVMPGCDRASHSAYRAGEDG